LINGFSNKTAASRVSRGNLTTCSSQNPYLNLSIRRARSANDEVQQTLAIWRGDDKPACLTAVRPNVAGFFTFKTAPLLNNMQFINRFIAFVFYFSSFKKR